MFPVAMDSREDVWLPSQQALGLSFLTSQICTPSPTIHIRDAFDTSSLPDWLSPVLHLVSWMRVFTPAFLHLIFKALPGAQPPAHTSYTIPHLVQALRGEMGSLRFATHGGCLGIPWDRSGAHLRPGISDKFS